jgi:hypothetical protein
MGHVFKHPKYYEELRKLRKEAEASSNKPKLQAPSNKLTRAPSLKRQAASAKLQAPSVYKKFLIAGNP